MSETYQFLSTEILSRISNVWNPWPSVNIDLRLHQQCLKPISFCPQKSSVASAVSVTYDPLSTEILSRVRDVWNLWHSVHIYYHSHPGYLKPMTVCQDKSSIASAMSESENYAFCRQKSSVASGCLKLWLSVHINPQLHEWCLKPVTFCPQKSSVTSGMSVHRDFQSHQQCLKPMTFCPQKSSVCINNVWKWSLWLSTEILSDSNVWKWNLWLSTEMLSDSNVWKWNLWLSTEILSNSNIWKWNLWLSTEIPSNSNVWKWSPRLSTEILSNNSIWKWNLWHCPQKSSV